ncbi:MAG: response regulator [Anaeromyxobacter sp.]
MSEEVQEQQGATASQPRPRMVLVIEDNLDAAQSLADLLTLHGHHVEVAGDGRTGLALAERLRPEVVLCDLGLPDSDGLAVARALRGADGTRAARLVALSGYGQPEDQERARAAGFDEHLTKPPDLEGLLASLSGGPRVPTT